MPPKPTVMLRKVISTAIHRWGLTWNWHLGDRADGRGCGIRCLPLGEDLCIYVDKVCKKQGNSRQHDHWRNSGGMDAVSGKDRENLIRNGIYADF